MMTNPTGTRELTLVQRQGILQREIGSYLSRGFRVVSQTEITAQLVRPKVFSCFWAIMGLLILYLIWYMAKRDKQVYIEVTPDGRVIHRYG